MCLKLVKHGLELELADRLPTLVIVLEVVEKLGEVVLRDGLIFLIDSYGRHGVQVLDLLQDLFLALPSFHHGVVLEDHFEEIGTVLFVLCDGPFSGLRLVHDAHTLVHIGVVLEGLLADRVEVVKQDETKGYEALKVSHAVETNQGRFIGKSNHGLFNIGIFAHTVFSICRKVRLFVALIEHDITDAIFVSENGYAIGLHLIKANLSGVPIVGVSANRRQF